MENKKVSVIMPTYKRPLFLKRAINSILAQEYHNVEVVVVDDNNDGDPYREETEVVMNSFTSDERVIYIKHHTNSNGSAARNTGISNAKGEYITFLDDDDYFLPGRIMMSVAFLNKSTPDIGGCCVNYIKKFKKLIYKKSDYESISSDCGNLLDGSIDYGAGSTLMLKKSVLDQVKGFNTTYKCHQDWEFLIRILRTYKIVNLPYIGVVISSDGIRNNPNTQLRIEMKKKLFGEFSIDIKALSVDKQRKILAHQRLEILHSHLIGRQYYSATILIRKFWFIDRYRLMKEIPHLLLSFIVGIFPIFMVIVYWFYNFKFLNYIHTIDTAEKKYK